jgi:hypothetical protein
MSQASAGSGTGNGTGNALKVPVAIAVAVAVTAVAHATGTLRIFGFLLMSRWGYRSLSKAVDYSNDASARINHGIAGTAAVLTATFFLLA